MPKQKLYAVNNGAKQKRISDMFQPRKRKKIDYNNFIVTDDIDNPQPSTSKRAREMLESVNQSINQQHREIRNINSKKRRPMIIDDSSAEDDYDMRNPIASTSKRVSENAIQSVKHIVADDDDDDDSVFDIAEDEELAPIYNKRSTKFYQLPPPNDTLQGGKNTISILYQTRKYNEPFNFPVTLPIFKRFINLNVIIEQILKIICIDPEISYDDIISNKQWVDCIKKEFYMAFYIFPIIRERLKWSVTKNISADMKRKLLLIPKRNRIPFDEFIKEDIEREQDEIQDEYEYEDDNDIIALSPSFTYNDTHLEKDTDENAAKKMQKEVLQMIPTMPVQMSPKNVISSGQNKTNDCRYRHRNIDENEMPVLLNEFKTWTNFNEIVQIFMRNKYKDDLSERQKTTRYAKFKKFMEKFFYGEFYKEPISRLKWPLKYLYLMDDCPKDKQMLVYEIPEVYRDNTLPSCIASASDKTQLHLILPLTKDNLLQKCIPVSFATFEKYAICNKIVKKILDYIEQAISAEDITILHKNQIELNQRIVQYYYEHYYIDVEIRRLYKIKFKPCPKPIKTKLHMKPKEVLLKYENIKNYNCFESKQPAENTDTADYQEIQISEANTENVMPISHKSNEEQKSTCDFDNNVDEDIIKVLGDENTNSTLSDNNNNSQEKEDRHAEIAVEIDSNYHHEEVMTRLKVHLPLIENYTNFKEVFPVDFMIFRKYAKADDLISEIIEDLSRKIAVEDFFDLTETIDLREFVLRYIYEQFYTNPTTRNKFDLSFKPAPNNIKTKLLAKPVDFCLERLDTSTTNSAVSETTVDSIKNIQATDTISSQVVLTPEANDTCNIEAKQSICMPPPDRNESIVIINRKYPIPDEILQIYILNKIKDATNVQKILDLAKERIKVQIQSVEILPKLKAQVQSVEILPKRKAQVQSVEILPPLDIATSAPREALSAEEMEKIENIYFQNYEKHHEVSYMLSTIYGLQQHILRVAFDMSFDEFCENARIYKCESLFEHKETSNNRDILLKFYNFAIRDRKTWPSNLYIPLENLMKFLLKKNIHLEKLDLSYILPNILHWSDLLVHTNLVDLVYLENLKDVDNDADMELRCKDYYLRCWNKNEWINKKIPAIITENICSVLTKYSSENTLETFEMIKLRQRINEMNATHIEMADSKKQRSFSDSDVEVIMLDSDGDGDEDEIDSIETQIFDTLGLNETVITNPSQQTIQFTESQNVITSTQLPTQTEKAAAVIGSNEVTDIQYQESQQIITSTQFAQINDDINKQPAGLTKFRVPLQVSQNLFQSSSGSTNSQNSAITAPQPNDETQITDISNFINMPNTQQQIEMLPIEHAISVDPLNSSLPVQELFPTSNSPLNLPNTMKIKTEKISLNNLLITINDDLDEILYESLRNETILIDDDDETSRQSNTTDFVNLIGEHATATISKSTLAELEAIPSNYGNIYFSGSFLEAQRLPSSLNDEPNNEIASNKKISINTINPAASLTTLVNETTTNLLSTSEVMAADNTCSKFLENQEKSSPKIGDENNSAKNIEQSQAISITSEPMKYVQNKLKKSVRFSDNLSTQKNVQLQLDTTVKSAIGSLSTTSNNKPTVVPNTSKTIETNHEQTEPQYITGSSNVKYEVQKFVGNYNVVPQKNHLIQSIPKEVCTIIPTTPTKKRITFVKNLVAPIFSGTKQAPTEAVTGASNTDQIVTITTTNTGTAAKNRTTKVQKPATVSSVVPQLTHEFRPLPLQIISKQTAAIADCARTRPYQPKAKTNIAATTAPGATLTTSTSTEVSTTNLGDDVEHSKSTSHQLSAAVTGLTASQAFSTDTTFFRSSQILLAITDVDKDSRNIEKQPEQKKPQMHSAVHALRPTTPSILRKVNVPIQTAVSAIKTITTCTPQNLNYKIVFFRRVLQYHYFQALNAEHIRKYELTCNNIGQSHQEAVISYDKKTKVYGDCLNAFLSNFPANIISDVKLILNDLKEFHFTAFDKLAVNDADDLRERVLKFFFQALPAFGHCRLIFDSASHERCRCEAIPKHAYVQPTFNVENCLTKALNPNILKRIADLKASI